MHISEATGRKDVNEFALSYLKAIEPELSHREDKGRIWFSEYVTTSLPEGRVDVINGHFGSIVAFYEWRNRNKDRKFDEIIIAGLKTMHDYLPLMIQDGYFSYARGHPHIKDYGQQRAVNFAAAACSLDSSICPTAERYKSLHVEWTEAK